MWIPEILLKLLIKMDNTESGNRMIAEFMGYTHEPEGILNRIPDTLTHPDKLTLHTYYYEDDYHPKYHSSWDWLMPALEKIRELNPDKGRVWFEYEISYCHCRIYNNGAMEWKNNGGTTLDAVWRSLTQFLEYINQQNLK